MPVSLWNLRQEGGEVIPREVICQVIELGINVQRAEMKAVSGLVTLAACAYSACSCLYGTGGRPPPPSYHSGIARADCPTESPRGMRLARWEGAP